MGTGTYGGGGGGTCSVGSSPGGYAVRGGRIVGQAASADEVRKQARSIFSALSKTKDYLISRCTSPLIQSIYDQLFQLKVEVFQNRSWNGVVRAYGVGAGRGCLAEWVDAVLLALQTQELDQTIREIARVSLEDFLMRALGDDPDLYIDGDADQILNALRVDVFDSASGHFLGALLHEILRREQEGLPPETAVRLEQAAQQTADRVVHAFEGTYYRRSQVTHRDLFRIFSKHPDWLREELRR